MGGTVAKKKFYYEIDASDEDRVDITVVTKKGQTVLEVSVISTGLVALEGVTLYMDRIKGINNLAKRLKKCYNAASKLKPEWGLK